MEAVASTWTNPHDSYASRSLPDAQTSWLTIFTSHATLTPRKGTACVRYEFIPIKALESVSGTSPTSFMQAIGPRRLVSTRPALPTPSLALSQRHLLTACRVHDDENSADGRVKRGKCETRPSPRGGTRSELESPEGKSPYLWEYKVWRYDLGKVGFILVHFLLWPSFERLVGTLPHNLAVLSNWTLPSSILPLSTARHHVEREGLEGCRSPSSEQCRGHNIRRGARAITRRDPTRQHSQCSHNKGSHRARTSWRVGSGCFD